MRVLVLYNDYQVLGGERLSVEEEVQGLRDAGVDCLLHTTTNDDIRGVGRAGTARLVAAGGPSRPELVELARRFRPDLVHAQNLFPLLARGAAEVLEATGAPWVRHLRNYRLRCLSADLWLGGGSCGRCRTAATGAPGVLHGCYRGSRAESAGAVVASAADRRLLRDRPPAGYIALSSGMGRLLAPALHPGVPVWVKPDGVTPQEPRLEADGGRELLFVGRLTEAKGYDLLLELARARPEQRFAVIGDGDGAAQVAAQAQRSGNLEWTPALPPQEVLDRMRRARAVLVPSQWEEPFGRVAMEALSVGTPAVVQAIGGLADIAAPVDPALAVQGRGTAAWLQALDHLDALGPAGESDRRRRAWEHFLATGSIEVTSRRLVGLYEEALAGSTAR